MRTTLVLAVLVLTGCASVPCETVPAMRAALDAIGPEYQGYVQRDPELTEEQRRRRLATLGEFRGLLSDLQALCAGGR